MLVSHLLTSAAKPGGWETCGDPATRKDSFWDTACPASASCCHQWLSPTQGHWGCVDFVDAQCCANGHTACPSGHRCLDRAYELNPVRRAHTRVMPDALFLVLYSRRVAHNRRARLGVCRL